MRKAWVRFLALSFCSAMLPAMSLAQDMQAIEAPKLEPKICLGYSTETGLWGRTDSTDGNEPWPIDNDCPAGYAFLGVNYRQPDISGNCCPLPSSDILTDNSVYLEGECQNGQVVTGYRREENTELTTQKLRCTEVNHRRYQLGAPTSGAFWGFSVSAAFPWRENIRYRQEEIPKSLFFGVSRVTQTEYENSGCIGQPFGSLLTTIGGTRCYHLFWRELQFNGKIPGDPPQGTAVPIYPDCTHIDNPYSLTAKCIRY